MTTPQQPQENLNLEPVPPKAHKLSIKIQDPRYGSSRQATIQLKSTTPLQKAINAFEKFHGINSGESPYGYFYESQRLEVDMTPESLEMRDGDVVEAQVHMIGGV
ncbi:hypothetical protein HYFRA_00011791 [Hymenoscyphus fraxineus]|uniref:Rad60/SUMO-like domain-containing protein n=1 Tax=Hymenoscyphus fraxineus TaxID=746836 RepID=A0A9N9L269_9HELO|nr:hypothetical protein HYFRA_00011791 [Hymenoscyphus fraxineus]